AKSHLLHSIPSKDGFWMPGEFEAHAKTWMLWPERPDTWREHARPAQKAFMDVALAIAQFEPVTMGVNLPQYENARARLPAQVEVIEIANNDSWMRDCGPIFVLNDSGQVRGIDWVFNAWGGLQGGLYCPWDLDDAVPERVLELAGLDRYQAPIVLEGGSIHVDGEGTLITTEECLLNPNRNPTFSRQDIEDMLKGYLNISKVIWLGQGVCNDETSGHVDNLCCFVRPGEVVLTWTDDKSDPQYQISQDAFRRLELACDARGRNLVIHKLHQPDPVLLTQAEANGIEAVAGTKPRIAGEQMAASYVNFYLCNGGLVVPTFNDTNDQLALEALQRIMPERKVVGVYAREILLGGGNIHCITQQQPKGK
ncbi:MAG TPA: agmatine deiminase, partial [Anaerolineales bacterium]